MQTFLPYERFAESAAVLDERRLGKQRVENLQILRALTHPDYGWRSHPAVLMWAGYEEALGAYALEVQAAWDALAFEDTTWASISDELTALGIAKIRTQDELAAAGLLPPWLGDPQVHRSHQSALVRKDPAHYRRYFADVSADLPYHWPVRSARVVAEEQRRAERAEIRRARAARRAEEEAAKAARRRSRAARKAARTRQANRARAAAADP